MVDGWMDSMNLSSAAFSVMAFSVMSKQAKRTSLATLA